MLTRRQIAFWQVVLGINLGAYTATGFLLPDIDHLPVWFMGWGLVSIIVSLVLLTRPIQKDR